MREATDREFRHSVKEFVVVHSVKEFFVGTGNLFSFLGSFSFVSPMRCHEFLRCLHSSRDARGTANASR